MSWKDIKSAIKVLGDYATQTLKPQNMPSGSRVYKPTVENGGAEVLQPDKTTALELLLQYLGMQNAEHIFKVHAKAISISLLDPGKTANRTEFDDWYKSIKDVIDAFRMLDTDFVFSRCVFGTWRPRGSNSHLKIYRV